MLVKYIKNEDIFQIEPGLASDGAFMITFAEAIELRDELDSTLKMMENTSKRLVKKTKKTKK